jgi:hypothetical protein
MLLLAIAGVSHEAIAEDYALTDLDDESARYLAQRRTSARALIVELLTGIDVEAALCGGGLTSAELATLRARLTAA